MKMLSEKIKKYLIDEGIFDESQDNAYIDVMLDLDITLDSAFAQFNMNTNAITLSGRKYEIHNICWFSINSDYELDIEAGRKALKLPPEYLPLDSFEAEHGFFYNRKDGSVIELEAGEKLMNFQAGKIDTKWDTFNDFLEWFFELDGKEPKNV